MRPDAAYAVSVRSLCEFTAKAGDLDLRFTPSPTAQEGVAGHGIVTARRGEGYERELSLCGDYQCLTVKGRADGYDPGTNRLEEIKTYRGNLERMPDNHRNLHWAQAKIYGCLLCRERQLDTLEVALVYFDIIDQRETVLTQSCSRDELEVFFTQQCDAFLAWAQQESTHHHARDAALHRLEFPYPFFRQGQRLLAEAVYRAAQDERYLLAEAPTGIGKTLATLFPVLKALPRQGLDKVFFLCAKTPGRQLALASAAQLQVPALRTLELVARDKSCEHPDKACHGESCPLATGFYDRLPAARAAACKERVLNQTRLRGIALAHDICPYYLAQEMSRWCDVIIGDYNYYFDTSALLHALTQANQWQVAVLIDEAHNLVDRARSMYTAELDQAQFRRAKKAAPASLKRPLDRLNRAWNARNRELFEQQTPDQFYYPLAHQPVELLRSLQHTTAAITDFLIDTPEGMGSELTRFYFDALHFQRIAELFDPQTFIADAHRLSVSRGAPGTRLCLRNLVPAALLAPRFATAKTATLFSATLQPAQFYRDLLGVPERLWHVSVPSPYTSAQLAVYRHRYISTRYRHRSASIAPIGRIIAAQFQNRPGNYLAFFSSYDYLDQVLQHMREEYPDLPVWSQTRTMNEAERGEFLQRFTPQGQGVGFAVLGGAFAEGVNLPGTRLIGAFIATLGLPQANAINEQLKHCMARLFGGAGNSSRSTATGYNYTYLYPGLRKVVQAAGRVIRTEQDRGVVHLIDDRFGEAQVQSLFPAWWTVTDASPDPLQALKQDCPPSGSGITAAPNE